MKKSTLHFWIGIIVTLLVALIALIPFIVNWCERDPNKEMSGEIESPKESSIVSSVFDVTVRLDKIPDNYHVWLMIKIGDNVWPKTELNRNYRRWVGQVHEFGSSDKFVLTLVGINKESHDQIIAWKTKKEKGDTKGWTPKKDLEYIAILDSVQLRLKNE